MRIMVTGGEGFLGQLLCRSLLENGHYVASWDTGWFSQHLEPIPGVNYRRGEVIEIDNLERFNAVVHLANFSCDPMADLQPGKCFGTNVGGTFHVAKVARRDGVQRFLYASTASIYGWNPHDVDESEPIDNVTSYYGVSKLAAERALQQLQSPNFSIVCFRMGTLGGVSPRMRLDLMVNTMCMFAKRGKITVSNPCIVRPHLDIRDARDAYIFALTRMVPLKGVYNLACSNHTLLEVANAVCSEQPCHIELQDVKDVRSYALDSSKIKRAGYQPYIDVKQTIRSVLRWLDSYEGDPLFDTSLFNIQVYKELCNGNQSLCGSGGV